MNPFELIYYLGLTSKKIYSLRYQKRLPFKVISIGNITVGGTGKTPAAIAVAEEAKWRGFSPVILTRGYKGKTKGPCFVTKGEGPLLSSDNAGDEPLLMSEKLQGIPVVKGNNRYKSGLFAVQNLGFQISGAKFPIIFILDDGFQHWKLHRDKDIALIDANNPFDNRKLLPFGRLREPVSSLARADIVVITKYSKSADSHCRNNNNLIEEIKLHNAEASIFFAQHNPVICRLISGEKKPAAWLSGKRILGFCALASPESFKNSLQSLGAEIAGFRTYKDHHRYKYADIIKIKKEAENYGADWIVTTEKDIIKIRGLDLPENILIIEIEFAVEGNFFDMIFNF